MAGAIISPVATLAGLLSANLRNLAYGLRSLPKEAGGRVAARSHAQPAHHY